MYYQDDNFFNEFINHFGCAIFSTLYKVEKLTGHKFTPEEINNLYIAAKQSGIVGKESYNDSGNINSGCEIKDWKSLFNLAGQSINSNFECINESWADKKYIPQVGEEEILELTRNEYNGSHFVSGNGITDKSLKQEIEYDPIRAGSICAAKGFIVSKRILFIKEI